MSENGDIGRAYYNKAVEMMDSPENMHLPMPQWSDYRGVFVQVRTPDKIRSKEVPASVASIWSQVIGTVIIMYPIVMIAYWLWSG